MDRYAFILLLLALANILRTVFIDILKNTFFRGIATTFIKHVMKGMYDALGNVLEEDQFKAVNGLSWSTKFCMMRNFFFVPLRFMFTVIAPNTSRQVALNKIESYVSTVKHRSLKAQNLNDWIDLLESSLSGFFDLMPHIMPR